MGKLHSNKHNTRWKNYLWRKEHCSKLGHWDSSMEVFAEEELSGQITLWKAFMEAFVLKVHKKNRNTFNALNAFVFKCVFIGFQCRCCKMIIRWLYWDICWIFRNLKRICVKSVSFCRGIDFAGKQICRVIDWRHWTR